MKTKLCVLFGAVISLWASFPIYAEEAAAAPKIVQDVYPGLGSGALSYAQLKDLPEGTLLEADGVHIPAENIAKIIDSQPAAGREELKKNAFFILEQEATSRILLTLAKKSLPQSKAEIPEEDNVIIQQFFEQKVFGKIEVTDREIKDFYENNKDMCGGATLDQIGPSLREYLVSQKKQQMASGYIRNLGRQIPIQVSESWVKQQAPLVFDNPVDKARQSKKPSLVDFGADGCVPCDMMAPILETLKKNYKDKVNVLFIHVRENQILASRYGIQSIPVQVFYDKDGKEVFRHIGFFAQEDIEKKLKEIGVQ